MIDFLAENCELSKTLLKKALSYGAVWKTPAGKKKRARVRKAKGRLNKGDFIEMFYDEKIISQEPGEMVVVKETKNWGIWYKPAGILSQGSPFGDHLSLLRIIEKKRNAEVFMVHRLDREAAGLVLIAYNKTAARELSKIWQEGRVRKVYQVEVKGKLTEKLAKKGKIEEELDGKSAETSYELEEELEKTSLVKVRIHTGRYHQIRRHFCTSGLPVMGDPKYGKGNKDDSGMALVASHLAFRDPMAKKGVEVDLPVKYRLFK